MKPDPNPATEADALRQQAEARLREQQAAASRRLSEAANHRLLHELQVHQVELELQNHALLELREKLERTLEQYTDLYDFAPVGYFTLARDGTIRTVNLAGAALLGMERAHLIEKRLGIFVVVADRPTFNAFLERVLVGIAREHCEIALAREGAPPRYLYLEGVAVRSGADWWCQVAAVDITERKRAEEALRAALEQKEMLLREVHHRVKNNLAAIIGLLELQQEGMTEGPLARQLEELGNRIRSMALVHEMLYQSANLNRIDFQEYLQTLVAHLRHAFDPQGAIRIAVAATGVYLDLDAAIPCGLIVNELVINALKYAFPERRPRPGASACEMTVTVAQDGTACTLTVADNGVGLPAGLDWATTRTLGLRLVRLLGRHQLGGQLELDGVQGTRCSLRFGSRTRPKSRPA